MPATRAWNLSSLSRTAVHVLLIVVVVGSLVVEPVLTAHILLGFVFIALAVVHLVQRRRTIRGLSRQVVRPRWGPAGRLAFADVLLALMTAAMFASGLVDWAQGHPTRIRWHAITGFLLAAALTGHTLRRGRRLRHSQVR